MREVVEVKCVCCLSVERFECRYQAQQRGWIELNFQNAMRRDVELDVCPSCLERINDAVKERDKNR